MEDRADAAEFYKRVFAGSWMTQGLWVAAELGIADLLGNGSRSVEALAEKTETDAGYLYRLMRALSSIGVFAEDEGRKFSLTPLAELLRTDVPGSLRPYAIMMGGEFHAVWGELLESVKTGTPGFDRRFGAHFFRYMSDHPERHRIYDACMESVHGGETSPMINAYDFSDCRTVVDIGGGNGSMLTAILDRYTDLSGILFDLPAVAARTQSAISGSKICKRLQIEAGDFFGAVPKNADLYMLRHILHDWEDPEAIAILRNCRVAMAPAAKIIVVEMVIPPGNEPSFGKWLDLMMLLVAGRERTEDEYGGLFSAAGLKLNRVIPTESGVSILEGIPV